MSEIQQMSSVPSLAACVPSTVAKPQHTPHQILGPYFPAVDTPIVTNDLTVVDGMAGRALGEIIVVEGRVLNRAGEPVEGARLVIWQANSFGRYAHPNDSNPAPLDANFVGFAEIISDRDGAYRFKTVKPGAYPAGSDRIRPPHVHFEVQGKFDRLITQMYFPDEPLNARDPLLLSANAPGLLVARSLGSPDNSNRTFIFNIVLIRG
jgi:protocatechuate 3,4-dioxygenase, beta subunit